MPDHRQQPTSPLPLGENSMYKHLSTTPMQVKLTMLNLPKIFTIHDTYGILPENVWSRWPQLIYSHLDGVLVVYMVSCQIYSQALPPTPSLSPTTHLLILQWVGQATRL